MTTCRNLDISPQILDFHRIYGCSDSTNPAYNSSSRSLNYANGASIQRAELETVSNIPQVINYKDTVGLFGVENHFIKIEMRLQNPILGNYIVNTYEAAKVGSEEQVSTDPYTFLNEGGATDGQAFIDMNLDTAIEETYEPAVASGFSISELKSSYFKVELDNLKTGNIYIDSWLDARLYNKYYDEHPYDIMYVRYNEPFYIGFHARNTKRLPYNVDVRIGQEDSIEYPAIAQLDEIDPRLLATRR